VGDQAGNEIARGRVKTPTLWKHEIKGSTKRISKLTGVNKETIVHILLEAGQEQDENHRWKDEDKCVEILRAWKEKKGNRAMDRSTGLTWRDASLREKTLRERRENRVAEKFLSKTYMLVADHHAILRIVAQRLEQIPNMLKSRMGLTEHQRNEIQKALDEARTAAGQEVVKYQETAKAEEDET